MKRKKVLAKMAYMACMVVGSMMLFGTDARAAGNIAIDETNFPDAAFRQYVIDRIDADKDGYLSEQECDETLSINCYYVDVYGDNKIESLEGIEFFSNLEVLNCWGQQVKNLDVSKNKELKDLACGANELEELHLEENTKLRSLNCIQNQLTKLDVAVNVDLENIQCNENQLTELDVHNNTKLTGLRCGENQIETLDVSSAPNLKDLNCSNNKLTQLDLSENAELRMLEVAGNQLSSIDVSKSSNLEILDCHNNQLSSLDVSKNTKLYYLTTYGNPISTLDISNCNGLKQLMIIGEYTQADGVDYYRYYFEVNVAQELSYESDVKLITGSFKDIYESDWYKTAVGYVKDLKIMNGVSEDSFGPMIVLTREQFITVLYNMEGAPEIAFKQIFDDVKNEKDVWYASSVTWAAEKKITSGVGDGLFGTGKEITREQLATLLYNYAGQKDEFKLTVDETAIANFPDADQVSEWAMTGMKWAVTNGVMGGKTGKDGKNILDPKGKATRAECAQMIMNLKEKAVK